MNDRKVVWINENPDLEDWWESREELYFEYSAEDLSENR